ncbi:ABC transporter permease [Kibdelosporangium phytohabitans]|uniref:ABC transporter permease n=1 Tax=Kibdelosporangium phytohabitans TaxID=860235 RepID=A0A0N7F3C2_9PSEU|nr:ABC transporter permease [Kibdelosporangium phytohabitans]ALG08223.1 ABC transporter permease [Kibdelosporangium phytohabitans]MBE1470773.1 putative ABC transport system permease protein [Kibdelosporangium phytohabitans]
MIPRSVFTPADALITAVVGMLARRGRALLTALGIAIGIAAMVAVVGISASSKANVLSVLDQLGTNYLTVTPGQSLSGGDEPELPVAAPGRLSLVDSVQAVAATAQLNETVRRSDVLPATNTKGTVVLVASPNLLTTLNGDLAQGHWLTAGAQPTVVLGATAALRQGVDLTGGPQLVWLGDQWFTVVGVLAPMPLAPELDGSALVSEQVAADALGYGGSPTTIYVRTDPSRIDDVLPVVAATANPQNPVEVEVTRPSDALMARAVTDTAFTTLLLGLGGVALLVGGVGIANVMVISVLERRTEIGVRRALGATRRHIRTQFLVEAVAQAGAGGLAGVLLGALVTTGYALGMGWPVDLPLAGLAGGVVAALVVGGAAGLYPASRAARLQPAEAVRSP